MAANEVWLDGYSNPVDFSTGQVVTTTDEYGKQVPIPSINQGSAVQVAPGLYLTDAHVTERVGVPRDMLRRSLRNPVLIDGDVVRMFRGARRA